MKLIIFLALCVVLCVSASPIGSEGEQEISPFIINGVRAPVAPYYAFIQYFNAAGLGFFGGGALISTRHVVTAATNVHGFARITVHLGSSNRTAMRSHEANVNAVTVHEGYNANTRANDIAVIRLVTAIMITAEVRPIALTPPNLINFVLPHENEEGLFVGMGFQTIGGNSPSPFLHRGYQRAVGNTRCAQFYLINLETGFCAEDVVERSSGCQGDIGNPFVLNYRRQEVLAGILTMHPTCGTMQPTAYTRVTFYRTWLQTQLLT